MKNLILFLMLFSGCSKTNNGEHCEKWKFYDRTFYKSSGTYSNAPINEIEANLCGDDLKGACEGCTVVVRDDGTTQRIRKFVKKVK